MKNLTKIARRILPFLRPRSDLLVFGSSILWGQGNLPADKPHAIFSRWIGRDLLERVTTHLFAHSGAHILGGGGNADLHGEIPRPEPSIMAQVEAAPDSGKRRVRILIEGGINDVGGTKIINPRTSSRFITGSVANACYRDMKTVMALITRKYPQAEIFIVGYYGILSERVGGAELREMQEADGDNEPGWDDYPELALKNSRLFLEESDRALRRLSEETDRSFPGSCRFVPSGFLEAEGMFGRGSLLFHPWESDPLIGIRARKCAVAVAKGQTGVHCFLASTAHPNQAGARRYAEQLIAAAPDGRESMRRSDAHRLVSAIHDDFGAGDE